MPRKPRLFLPGVAVHAVQRGVNKGAIFFDDLDYLEYLRCLKRASDQYGCQIHAYVLMTNHVHILMTPESGDSIARLFQGISRFFVPYINETYQRSGGLWEGRYRASLVDSEVYLLSCMRYVEMNPVRAGMVNAPGEYRWSSYPVNGLGGINTMLTPHPAYLGLGASVEVRLPAYRELFHFSAIENDDVLLRNGLNSGTPVGSTRFMAQIEQALGRKVGFAKRGRPPKKVKEK